MRIVFFLIAALWGAPAAADVWWSALGWACEEDAGQLTIYPVNFDGNLRSPASRQGLFVQTQDLEAPRVPLEIFRCQIVKSGEVTLRRTFQNIPRPRGDCGGAPWAEFELRIEGESTMRFVNGCASRPLLLVGVNEMRLCEVRRGECRSKTDGPLKLGLHGGWSKD